MKPILFSTPMVQAILAGKKTQTRRVVKFPRDFNVHRYDGIENGKHLFAWGVITTEICLDGAWEIKAPCNVGDVLWVRETWRLDNMRVEDGDGRADVVYKAGGTGPRIGGLHGNQTFAWRPSIFMPHEAARLYLKVTDLRAERVQDIFEEPPGPNNPIVKEGFSYGCDFIGTWENLNAKRGFGWKTNPWVWVISFEKTEKPESEG